MWQRRSHDLFTNALRCACSNCTNERRYATDAADAVRYGFDGVKFDSERGGADHNISLWAAALNGTGKQMMIENCLDKHPAYMLTAPGYCPFNYYRAGPDNSRSFYGGITSVYEYTTPFVNATVAGVPASRPGCFAYADMLGIGSPIHGTAAWQKAVSKGCSQMSLDEERTLFSNWVIVSSPLVLGLDVADDAVVAKYWPIIANERVLAIHAAWAGEAGRLLREGATSFDAWAHIGATCEVVRHQQLPTELLYSKMLGHGAAAVLLVNLANTTATDTTLSLSELRLAAGAGATATEFDLADAWTGAPLGRVNTASPSWRAAAIAPRASAFVVASPAGSPWVPPTV